MATMSFDLVSPERNMASGAATMVTLPGVEGDVGAMAGHMPFVTTLRPGVLTAAMEAGEQRFAVFGGFAEITPTAVTVLADDVMPIDELNAAAIDDRIADAEQAVGASTATDADTVARAAQYLVDLRNLKMLRGA